jgi:uncharacterized repeat protein (TIGR01451 family)
MRASNFTTALRAGHLFALLLILAGLFLAVGPARAMTAAGTSIGNQASATYSDASQTVRTVTSNTVVTIVQQVASLTLTANGARNVAPGGQVAYPHTLTNTGNGSDSFSLATANSGAFTFGSVAIYADANGDGVPDNATPITGSGDIPAGGSFRFVVVGTAPATAAPGSANSLTLTAASAYTPAVTAANTDSTTVSGNAVVSVSKAIDVASGAAGSGPRTFTLTYTNTGNGPASNLTLTDLLPSGMTYVANSARWSATGATVLTDANAADDQGGLVYDFGVSAANRVTAVVASVPAGATGTLRFQVTIASGLAAGANAATLNTAGWSYNDGAANVPAASTNGVQFVVAQNAAVSMTGATVASAPQGGTVLFTHTVTNTGNGSDSFDLAFGASTFPAGTTFVFYQADGVTPLIDSNGNGTPDTGPLAAGAGINVVVKAILPPGASGSGPYTVQSTAASRADATRTASATDTLTTINANTVDLTNNAAGAGAPGVGAGPEAGAAVTNIANPGATTRFTLVVANASAQADTFNLQASSDSTFAGLSLPAGWSVSFKDANGAVLTNTGVVNAGASLTVYADVTVPAGAPAGTVDLYFRAVSPTSGAADRLHDAVQVATLRSLTLAPNHAGQAYPGGIVVYAHTLANGGNVTEGDAGQVALAVTDSATGFSAAVYWDKNNNGVLDAGDPVVTNLSQLTGGSNGASTAAGLTPGESVTLFVKVYAPTGAPVGAVDTASLTVTASGSVNGAAAPAAVTATDSTTVIAGQVQLSKLQALDANCDGSPDAAYTAANLGSGAIPGACIRYQITAGNVGVADVTAVVVSDATPANTTYHGLVAAAVSRGTVTAPAAGSSGTVQASVGALSPGQSVVLSFGVRINP